MTHDLERVLSYLDPNCSRDEWLRIAMALKRDDDANFALFDAWSSQGDSYSLCACQDVWKQQPKEGGATLGTLIHLAQQNGYGSSTRQPIKPSKRKAPKPKKEKKSTVAADIAEWHTLPERGFSAYFASKGVADVALEVETIRFGASWYGRPAASALLQAFADNGTLEPRGTQKYLDQAMPNGKNKMLSTGMSGRKIGAFIVLGEMPDADAEDEVWIVEGAATGLSNRKATATTVLAALDAGNILPVVAAVRKHRPKLTIKIAADNDQKTPNNPGHRAAMEAALAYGCYTVTPDFNGIKAATDAHTDFNDLEHIAGIDVVRQQLLGAEIPKKHRLPPVRFDDDTVTVIRGTHSLGKSYQVKEEAKRVEARGEHVLSAVHSRQLAIQQAGDLGITPYFEVDPDYRRSVGSISGTLHNLFWMRDKEGKPIKTELFVLDECEQAVPTLNGNHMTFKKAVWDTLKYQLNHVKKAILCDADAGPETEALLKLACPHRRVNWVTYEVPIGEGREVRLHKGEGDILQALKDACAADENVFYVSNSKAKTEQAKLLAANAGYEVEILTSENSQDKYTQDMMKDLEAHCEEQGVQIFCGSPAMKAGNSYEAEFFTRVFGVFTSRVGRPTDALQQLHRVRTPVPIELWVDPTRRTEFVNPIAKYGALQDHENQAVSGRYDRLQHVPELTEIRVLSETITNDAQRDFKGGLLALLRKQGFTIVEQAHDPEAKALLKEARELRKQKHLDALEHDPEHEQKREAIAAFYRLQEGEPIRPWLEQDNDGRYRRSITYVERATGAVDIDAIINETAKTGVLRDDVDSVAKRAELHRKVLEESGLAEAAAAYEGGALDQLTLSRYTKEKLRHAFVPWCEQNRSWLEGLWAMPSRQQLWDNPVRYLGSLLKTLGLKQKRVNVKTKEYALDVESLGTLFGTLERRYTLSACKSFTRKVYTPPEPDKLDLATVFSDALRGALAYIKQESRAHIRELISKNDTKKLERLWNQMPAELKQALT